MTEGPFALATAAASSFALAALIVLSAARHGQFSMDVPGSPQSFHARPTPRIGGVGIYLAFLVGTLSIGLDARRIGVTILVAGLPALAAGLLEDVTKRVGVGARLAGTMASGCLAALLSGVVIAGVHLPPVDALLQYAPVAILFTAFAVSGLANAINIIDGFHGLASGTTVICASVIAAIAALAGDPGLSLAAAMLAAVVAGFWFVNFPWGKLFLGDGGAYFAGFALAWLAVLLPARNPGVSPWASLLVCAYPIIEVIYSIVRRRRARRPPGSADRAHLHSLVAMHIVQRRFPRMDPTLQNAGVAVIMWTFSIVPAVTALAFFRHTDLLMAGVAACAAGYHFAYRRITRK